MSVQKSTWSCTKLELCMSVKTSTVACACHIAYGEITVTKVAVCKFLDFIPRYVP